MAESELLPYGSYRCKGNLHPPQAFLYTSTRMFLRKIPDRESSRGRLLWSYKPAREEQSPNEQKALRVAREAELQTLRAQV